MNRAAQHFPISLLLAIGAAALPAAPVAAAGPIGTMARGNYICELPGDAGAEVGVRVPERDFSIGSASRYTSAMAQGTYLRRGDVLTLTSGARKGEAYSVISEGFLRLMENGQPGKLRCIRLNR